MKIGILTYHYSNNYGALLQTFALSTFLKNNGHEPIIINRKPDIKKNNNLYNQIRNFIIRLFQNYFCRSFYLFRKHFLPNISIRLYENDLKEYIKDFDAIIVGSDQVWRLDYTQGLGLNYFLDFVPDKIKKISYAASFGKEQFDGDKKQIEQIKNLLSRFDFISVREDSAVTLCKNLFEVNSIHVLDPSLILQKEDYKIITDQDKVTYNKKYIAVYLLDITKEKRVLINNFSMDLKTNLLNISVKSNKPFNLKRFGLDSSQYKFPAVHSWLNGIINSDYVITDSFHGVVFSIIFNKRFVCISNEYRGLSRINSLLNVLGITKQLISEQQQITNINTLFDINYNEVNEILKIQKGKSINFLISSLKKQN